MKWLFTIFLCCLILVGCAPSDLYFQTADAETETAKSPGLDDLESTQEMPPTLLSSSTPSIAPLEASEFPLTESPTELPTVTPIPDRRIILGDPEDYILARQDVPDQYILKSGNSTPHLNQEILYVRGVEDGNAYLEATGRIGGWIIRYDLVDSDAIAPLWIRSYVVMYDNVDGPDLTVSPAYDSGYEDYEVLDVPMDLGEWNLVLRKTERQSSGKNIIWYAIEFIYRNVWAQVMGYGYESKVNHDYLENLARTMLENLQNAPLGEPKSDGTLK